MFFTDGITEARTVDGEEYGYDRFEDFIKQHAHLSSKELRDKILDDYHEFTKGLAEADDDVTVVVVKVR